VLGYIRSSVLLGMVLAWSGGPASRTMGERTGPASSIGEENLAWEPARGVIDPSSPSSSSTSLAVGVWSYMVTAASDEAEEVGGEDDEGNGAAAGAAGTVETVVGGGEAGRGMVAANASAFNHPTGSVVAIGGKLSGCWLRSGNSARGRRRQLRVGGGPWIQSSGYSIPRASGGGVSSRTPLGWDILLGGMVVLLLLWLLLGAGLQLLMWSWLSMLDQCWDEWCCWSPMVDVWVFLLCML